MSSILTEWGKKCFEKLIKGAIAEARFVFCFTCIAKEFEEERDRLEAEGITSKVARGKNKKIQANVVFWDDEVDKLLKEDAKTKQTCFFGFCPDCISRYKRGKELANGTRDIKRLTDKGGKFGNIEIRRRLPDLVRYSPYSSQQDYISFKSRESKYKELLDALKDDNNYITGLQGMDGSGKTTLAKVVCKELKESGQFTHVIDTKVSFIPDIKNIQHVIARPLGLEWEDCNESDRPKKLSSRLGNGEKILLIMDDVWAKDPPLDFDAIGIPKRDNHKGCRVLVISRSKQIFNKMDCDKRIEMDLLSEEDSWIMFKRYANISDSSSKNLINKGRKIAKECKQIPAAIAATASSLKGQQSLEMPISMHGVDRDVRFGLYKELKLSYDHMKDEKAKGLFLLCSVFREDDEISIEVLTRLGIGAGLFGEDYGSYDDARNQVVVVKNKLVHSYLLQVHEEIVRMQNLVRDWAQRIIGKKEIQAVNFSDKNQKSLVEKETNIKHLLCEGTNMDFFLWKFDGSKLETLIVKVDRDEDRKCIKVPNSFFENIIKLRVLYFSGNYMQPLSLPHSIRSLTNIRSILVDGIDLGDISVLGNLQSLETLDLVECTIIELPNEITKLENFKLLNLELCEIRRNNPFEVIEKCSSLEELYFIDSFNDFCQEITLPELQRYHIKKRFDIMIDSLSKCVKFCENNDENSFSSETFKYCMPKAEVLQLDRIEMGWRNLMPEIVPIDPGMNVLVELRLSCISKLQYLIDTIGSQVPIVLFNLVVLELDRMENLEELFNGPLSFDFLKNLEKLSIMHCEHLQRLFKCKLNLCNLKFVTLRKCPMLISLFQVLTSQNFVLLERLEIYCCEGLENIIIDERREEKLIEEIYDDHDDNGSMFPKLKVIDIEGCPRLESILPLLSAQDFPVLETVRIRRCDELKYIFGQYQNVKLGSLKQIHLSQVPNFIDIFPQCYHSVSMSVNKSSSTSRDGNKYRHTLGSTSTSTTSLISRDQPQDYSITSASNSYRLHIWERARCLLAQPYITCNLKEITLSHFSKINLVFFLAIASRMLLETLTIRNCDELKNIVIDNEDHDSGSNKSGNVFPNLKRLHVEDCVQLKYIFGHYTDDFKIPCSEIHLHLPALECLYLCNLPSLVAMCSKQYHTTFPPLEELDLNRCSQIAIDDFIIHHSVTRSVNGAIRKELMNEKSLGQQYLTNQRHPLGETDTTIKHSQGIEISVEEGTTLTKSKTITSSTHLELADGDGQIAITKPLTTQDDQVSLNDDAVIKGNSIIEEEFPKDVEFRIPESKISSIVPSPQAFFSVLSGDPSDIDEELEDGDNRIAITSFCIATTETNDQVYRNDDAFKKISSNVEEQFPKDDDITVSKSKPSPSITSQFPFGHSKEDDLSQKVKDLSSYLLVKSELEQLVSKNHLDYENLSLLTGFLVKHPSVHLKDTSLRNRYKGCAYNLLAELLKFLETHSMLDVLGSCHSEFVELLLDARNFGFDKDWLDGVERRTLFLDLQVSQDALKKLLDSKEKVTKDVEVLRLKIGDLKHQLTTSEIVLENIIQQEATLSAPIGY